MKVTYTLLTCDFENSYFTFQFLAVLRSKSFTANDPHK